MDTTWHDDAGITLSYIRSLTESLLSMSNFPRGAEFFDSQPSLVFLSKTLADEASCSTRELFFIFAPEIGCDGTDVATAGPENLHSVLLRCTCTVTASTSGEWFGSKLLSTTAVTVAFIFTGRGVVRYATRGGGLRCRSPNTTPRSPPTLESTSPSAVVAPPVRGGATVGMVRLGLLLSKQRSSISALLILSCFVVAQQLVVLLIQLSVYLLMLESLAALAAADGKLPLDKRLLSHELLFTQSVFLREQKEARL